MSIDQVDDLYSTSQLEVLVNEDDRLVVVVLRDDRAELGLTLGPTQVTALQQALGNAQNWTPASAPTTTGGDLDENWF
ncbi:hypothetical protein [Tsukamurella ocularis]|uniref:hypothetical protein n=1 Tax=Tsukamurella ocularis TaxID=1970234 RepID=UPI00216936DC|nr:hypothetical protein [Tsukamurella ocularis]MCS3853293.1 hypothetical protein [Tsukamurella ocularis]